MARGDVLKNVARGGATFLVLEEKDTAVLLFVSHHHRLWEPGGLYRKRWNYVRRYILYLFSPETITPKCDHWGLFQIAKTVVEISTFLRITVIIISQIGLWVLM